MSISDQIQALRSEMAELAADREHNLEQRGTCSKYLFKSGRNDCRAREDEQNQAIELRMAIITQEIQQLQNQSNSGSGGNAIDDASSLVAGNSGLLIVGMAALAAAAYIFTKNPKNLNQNTIQ